MNLNIVCVQWELIWGIIFSIKKFFIISLNTTEGTFGGIRWNALLSCTRFFAFLIRMAPFSFWKWFQGHSSSLCWVIKWLNFQMNATLFIVVNICLFSSFHLIVPDLETRGKFTSATFSGHAVWFVSFLQFQELVGHTLKSIKAPYSPEHSC